MRALCATVLPGLLSVVLASCGGGEDPGGPGSSPDTRTIGGSIAGLDGTLILQVNGANDLTLTRSGTFTFGAALASGTIYSVTVLTQPAGQTCNVTGGSGAANTNVTAVIVTCAYDVASGLPLLRINTTSGAAITSRDVYVTGEFELLDALAVSQASGALEIRGRGNSTWNYPKKPYRMKLGSSTALLGMPANKHWVLLANYLDKTLVRNDVAFEFSRRVGMAWTPRSVQVVVELNGEYLGIYMLAEHVRIGGERVNIPELKKTDTAADLITGGYLIEVDYRQGEDYCRHTLRGVWLCFGNPETLLEPDWAQHKAYIDGYIDAVESALYGPQFADPVMGYAAYLDVDSAVNFYLVQELLKNPDSNFFASVFLYKPRGGKLTFGPVWDFDLAINNAQWNFSGGWDPTGWHTRNQDNRVADTNTNWYVRLFEDPAFVQKVRARWAQLRASGAIDGLLPYIDRRAAWLSQVQAQNFQRWTILNTVLPPQLSPVTGPYSVHVDSMRSWLQQRITWMDAQLR
jgi:hypothetical protein